MANTACSVNGKPPRLSNFSIGVDLGETEQLCAVSLGDTTQGVGLGMIKVSLKPISKDKELLNLDAWSDLSDESDSDFFDAPSELDEFEDFPDLDSVDNSMSGSELSDIPDLQSMSATDIGSEDSMPGLQSVSNSDIKTVSKTLEGVHLFSAAVPTLDYKFEMSDSSSENDTALLAHQKQLVDEELVKFLHLQDSSTSGPQCALGNP
jgi:hypothetical protein